MTDIGKMTEQEIAVHVYHALTGSVSGQVLWEFLRTHCFMRPGPEPKPWDDEERLAYRYGRMTLFQKLEYYVQKGEIPPADR